MNKKLLLLLAVVGIASQSTNASFFDRLKEKAKQVMPTLQKEIQKKMEAKTYKKGATAAELQFTPISFQLRNKAAGIWVSVSSGGTPGEIKMVAAGSPKSPTALELPVDISLPTVISIWTSEPTGREADQKYSVPLNKTIYVTWDGKLRKQTGEAWGALGKTTLGGYSFTNNVTDADIRPV